MLNTISRFLFISNKPLSILCKKIYIFHSKPIFKETEHGKIGHIVNVMSLRLRSETLVGIVVTRTGTYGTF